MSSMRNAVQRRQHRERGQLEGREKWGILEKHKDYSLRAKDYNEKKAKLKRLQEKAKDRNPEEFYFGMVGKKNAQQGKHGRGVGVSRDSAAAHGLSHDAIKLLKTQDQNYLRTVGERIRRQIERLEHDVQLQEGMNKALGVKSKKNDQDGNAGDVDDLADFDGFDEMDELDFGAPVAPKPRKVLFADDKGVQQSLVHQHEGEDSDSMDEDSEPDQPESTASRKSAKQLAAEKEALREARRARKIRKRVPEARENKLAALRRQYAEIQKAEQEVELQRGKMDRSVGGTNKHGLKWKVRERKR
ncbi:U3 small nucleolar RNA-associated protein 11 [Penicillium diatomitis]|uniref:U3 small nucleolar RNA-associated protein 11 n=1 Tax=Penicillium diatomitis TaxID=2819901 RepID=A0A9W9XFV4_9EURO|nr:U3 small nucleolar RNA-associated protein 11 [Penicillium diatomitis]KAJ5490988.1 U3 small nucleolar RNA-associated protein 11 [Penicillium diatomitis]